MAFQTARVGGAADAGQGTFIHHLAKAPKAPRYILVLRSSPMTRSPLVRV
jgi:hypothetical protein